MAHEQGLLQQPSLNPFQYWALRYAWIMREERRTKEREILLKEAAFVFNQRRYVELFAKPLQEISEEAEGLPISPDEFDDIERWFQSVDKKRVGQVPADEEIDDDEKGWI